MPGHLRKYGLGGFVQGPTWLTVWLQMSSHSVFAFALDSSHGAFIPGPSLPLFMVSMCVSTVLTFQCDGAGWVVATHSVVMDTLRFRLSCICGSTLLAGTIPQAHLLLMSLSVCPCLQWPPSASCALWVSVKVVLAAF